MTTIGFIGVGKLGHPVAVEMARVYSVVGYDPTPFEPTTGLQVGTFEDAARQDIIFVAVPTPHAPEYGGETPSMHLPVRDFDYSIVEQTLDRLNPLVGSHQLVVLISTVLPGTVRGNLGKRFNGDLIYNPYLIAMGTVGEDFINPEMIIIGSENPNDPILVKKINRLRAIYDSLCGSPRYEIGTWEEAEAIKIFYNTFISMKLSFVNMIQDVAMASGNMNVDVVTGALKRSTQRITGPAYMNAGFGDAGACVLPTFNVTINGEIKNMETLYDEFHATTTRAMEVSSTDHACETPDIKSIQMVTKNPFNGKLIKITTDVGEITVTPNHLMPVSRDGIHTIIEAKDIIETDELFYSKG